MIAGAASVPFVDGAASIARLVDRFIDSPCDGVTAQGPPP
jgi:hypothetical protein